MSIVEAMALYFGLLALVFGLVLWALGRRAVGVGMITAGVVVAVASTFVPYPRPEGAGFAPPIIVAPSEPASLPPSPPQPSSESHNQTATMPINASQPAQPSTSLPYETTLVTDITAYHDVEAADATIRLESELTSSEPWSWLNPDPHPLLEAALAAHVFSDFIHGDRVQVLRQQHASWATLEATVVWICIISADGRHGWVSPSMLTDEPPALDPGADPGSSHCGP